MINEVEEWRKKFEQSELARQKLKQTIRLLKEKEVNTVELLRQKTQLVQKLETEQNARKKAEAILSKYKKNEIELSKKVEALEQQLETLSKRSNAQTQQSKQNRQSSIKEVSELTELRAQVEGHDTEIQKLNRTVAHLLGVLEQNKKAGDTETERFVTRKSAKIPENGRLGVGDSPRGITTLGRKRVASTPADNKDAMTKKGKFQSAHDEDFEMGSVAAAPQEQPPTVPPRDRKDNEICGPASDRMLRALSLILEVDGDLDWNVIQDVASEFQSVRPPPHSLTVAVLSSAILSCANALPMPRLLHNEFSPESWFTDTRQGASFAGVWCKESCMENHTLFWLLHAIKKIDEASSRTTTNKGAILPGLEKELSSLVLKELVRSSFGSGLHSPTELCTAATGAACLYRMLGDFLGLQRFLLDILMTRQIVRSRNEDKNENKNKNVHKISQVLPVVAAVVEVWPEAVPREKGVLGSLLHGVLVAAAREAQESLDVDVRVSGYWLADKGRQEWGWKKVDVSDDIMETTQWQGLVSFAGPIAARPASLVN